MTKTKTSPVLAAAMRRGAQFLRPPAELSGQRALHHLRLADCIETAMSHAILAGLDEIAFSLSALRNDAAAAFCEDVMGGEMAYLGAEIAECEQLLAERANPAPTSSKKRRKLVRPSPGKIARKRLAKRGAISVPLD